MNKPPAATGPEDKQGTTAPSEDSPPNAPPKAPPPGAQFKQLLADIAFNIAIPSVVLMKTSSPERLGATWALVVALAFPLLYGLRDLKRTGKFNLFSVIGVVTVAINGGIALLHLDPKYIAWSEAAKPTLFGLAIVLSLYTPYPLIRSLFYNDKLMQTKKIDRALDERNNHPAFEKCLATGTWIFGSSFLLSAVLNYVLAILIVQSPTGTEAFNEELGRMTALSWPVIALPSTIVSMAALLYVVNRLQKLTGLSIEEVLNVPDVTQEEGEEKKTEPGEHS